MLKQITSIIIASLIVLLLSKYLTIGLNWVQALHNWLYEITKAIFSDNALGIILRKMIALLVIPLVCVGVPAGLYYVIYRKSMPYFTEAVWVVWIILATAMLLK